MNYFAKRRFLRNTMMGGIALVLLSILCAGSVSAFYQSPQIPLFQTALRAVGPGQIPVAAPGPLPAPVTGVTHYDILISQFQDQILPIGFPKTTLWGYNPLNPLGGGSQPQKHLGGILVTKGRNPNDSNEKAIPIQLTFRNLLLNGKHILPVDRTVMMTNDKVNSAAIHLHGGLVPWISDGGPFDWFDAYGNRGLSFLNNQVLNPSAPIGAAEYYYPMDQSARFMWYHDHAHGITRLNAYAGLATGMLVRDNFEKGLIAKGLPPYIETSVLSGGKIPIQELPLVFQDKIFVGNDISVNDPSWNSMVQAAAAKPGSLWYAHTYEPNLANGAGRWDWGPLADPSNNVFYNSNLPDPSNVPEFFGDTMLVNGTVFPEATVEARRYRLRMLNACNARFLNLQLYIDNGTANGITLDTNPLSATYGTPLNTPFVNAATGDSSWLQIGAEGGFLSTPAKVPSNVPFLITDAAFLAPGGTSLNPSLVNKSLLVAPAERPDLIVDFSALTPGTKVVLYNDAAAPFPLGDDRNDYFPGWNVGTGLFGVGNPINGVTQAGYGPNTRVLMRFKVVAATTGDVPLQINAGTTDLTGGIDRSLVLDANNQPTWNTTDITQIDGVPTQLAGVPRREITLNEYFDDYGRLIQIIGNAAAPYGAPYDTTSSYGNYPTTGTPATIGASEEKVNGGATEIWEVYNVTGDVHPMHIHLVNTQVLNRQQINVNSAAPNYTTFGNIIPPFDNEKGWKETIQMYPGTVTRLLMKFDLSKTKIVDKNGNIINTIAKPLIKQLPITNGMPPYSPRLKTMFGVDAYEYVWHCHILEHEEHDMMHTLAVTP